MASNATNLNVYLSSPLPLLLPGLPGPSNLVEWVGFEPTRLSIRVYSPAPSASRPPLQNKNPGSLLGSGVLRIPLFRA